MGTTDRLVRSRSGAPSNPSSSWIEALRVDWLTLQAEAACPKWQRSTTASRYRNWRRVGTGFMHPM